MKRLPRVSCARRLHRLLVVIAAATTTIQAEAAVLAYVPNQTGASVNVVNLTSGAVVATIPVGTTPIGVAAAPNARRVYVANHNSHTVSVISTSTDTVVDEISSGPQPVGVAVSPNGARLYVSNFLTATASGGGSLWVNGTVTVIDTATLNPLFSIFVGANPTGVAVSPDGSWVYVANAGSGTLSVIATATNTVTTTILVGANPVGVAASPDGQRVYVANGGSASVTVIDAATLGVTATVPVGGHAMGIAVSDDSSRVVVSNTFDHSVSVINAGTLAVSTTTAGIGPGPAGVAFAPASNTAWVANSLGATISSVDALTGVATATGPNGLGWPVSLGRFVFNQPDWVFSDGFE